MTAASKNAASPGEVSDGFGSIWPRCTLADCDLQVVRPGKVQCHGRCQEYPYEEMWP